MSIALSFRGPSRLSPISRAALWVVAGGICGTLMSVLIRQTATEIHPFEITFFRCLFALLFMVPWIAKVGIRRLRTAKIGFYTLRAGVSLISMLTWFYGISLVPLSTATALNFTSPLFATMGAALVLHEQVRLRRWIAVLVGFAGVMIVLRPGAADLDANLLIILVSAALAGMGVVTVRFLARSEPPNTIVVYMVIYLTPLSLPPALMVWTWPSWHALGLMVLLGGVGVLAHLATTRAYSTAEASACTPFEFLRLPFAALLGFLLFDEVTDLWTWVGAGIIAVSSIYIVHREAVLARRARLNPPRAPA